MMGKGQQLVSPHTAASQQPQQHPFAQQRQESYSNNNDSQQFNSLHLLNESISLASNNQFTSDHDQQSILSGLAALSDQDFSHHSSLVRSVDIVPAAGNVQNMPPPPPTASFSSNPISRPFSEDVLSTWSPEDLLEIERKVSSAKEVGKESSVAAAAAAGASVLSGIAGMGAINVPGSVVPSNNSGVFGNGMVVGGLLGHPGNYQLVKSNAASTINSTPSSTPSNSSSGAKKGGKKRSDGGASYNQPATAPTVIVREGVEWLSFFYTNKGKQQEYTIRIDMETVHLDRIPIEFRHENCIYPRAINPTEAYNRLEYETNCNELAFKLTWLNPATLSGRRGLIQRAVDSFRNRFPETRSRRVVRQEKIHNGTLRRRTTEPKAISVSAPKPAINPANLGLGGMVTMGNHQDLTSIFPGVVNSIGNEHLPISGPFAISHHQMHPASNNHLPKHPSHLMGFNLMQPHQQQNIYANRDFHPKPPSVVSRGNISYPAIMTTATPPVVSLPNTNSSNLVLQGGASSSVAKKPAAVTGNSKKYGSRSSGSTMLTFHYSTKGQSNKMTLNVNIDSVDVNELDYVFKRNNAIFPRALLEKESFQTPVVWQYENESNEIGWKLAWLNPKLTEQKPVLHKAVEAFRAKFDLPGVKKGGKGRKSSKSQVKAKTPAAEGGGAKGKRASSNKTSFKSTTTTPATTGLMASGSNNFGGLVGMGGSGQSGGGGLGVYGGSHQVGLGAIGEVAFGAASGFFDGHGMGIPNTSAMHPHTQDLSIEELLRQQEVAAANAMVHGMSGGNGGNDYGVSMYHPNPNPSQYLFNNNNNSNGGGGSSMNHLHPHHHMGGGGNGGFGNVNNNPGMGQHHLNHHQQQHHQHHHHHASQYAPYQYHHMNQFGVGGSGSGNGKSTMGSLGGMEQGFGDEFHDMITNSLQQPSDLTIHGGSSHANNGDFVNSSFPFGSDGNSSSNRKDQQEKQHFQRGFL